MLLLISTPSSYFLASTAILSYILIESFFFSVANKFVVIYRSINKSRYARNYLFKFLLGEKSMNTCNLRNINGNKKKEISKYLINS